MAEKQRDDALNTVKVLAEKVEQLQLSSYKNAELRGMPIHKLKSLQVKYLINIFELKHQLTQFFSLVQIEE